MVASASSLRVLSARARALNAAARVRGVADGRLPTLFFFTDPARTPDPCAVARRLPRGATIVYRHFGAANRDAVARELRRIAWRRGLTLLIGADTSLARRVHADGVHLPESGWRDLRRLHTHHPRWLLTIAAHSGRALARFAQLGADAVVLAPVLPSRSSAARAPIGVRTGAAMARRIAAPVIALGGVHARTRIRPGFAGLAAIDAFLRD